MEYNNAYAYERIYKYFPGLGPKVIFHLRECMHAYVHVRNRDGRAFLNFFE